MNIENNEVTPALLVIDMQNGFAAKGNRNFDLQASDKQGQVSGRHV